MRSQLRHASAAWLAGAVALEVLQALSYVLILPRGVLPTDELEAQLSDRHGRAGRELGAIGERRRRLALGAWALRRGGDEHRYIGRRTVAFFILTSLANVVTLVVFAALYALGVLTGDRNPGLTYGFGAAALVATAIVVFGLPRVSKAAPVRLGCAWGRSPARAGLPAIRSGKASATGCYCCENTRSASWLGPLGLWDSTSPFSACAFVRFTTRLRWGSW